MLRNVDSSPSILAAECKSLRHSQQYEDYWCSNSNLRVIRKQSNRRSRAAHDQQRRQKREFSSDEIAEAAKEQRAQWTNGETNTERRERLEEIGGWISGGIKLRRENRRQTSENEEVVPLDHRAGCRRRDDAPDFHGRQVTGIISYYNATDRSERRPRRV